MESIPPQKKRLTPVNDIASPINSPIIESPVIQQQDNTVPNPSILLTLILDLIWPTILVTIFWFIYKPVAAFLAIHSVGGLVLRISNRRVVETWGVKKFIFAAIFFGFFNALVLQYVLYLEIITYWPVKVLFYVVSTHNLYAFMPTSAMTRDPMDAITHISTKLRFTSWLALVFYLLSTFIFWEYLR